MNGTLLTTNGQLEFVIFMAYKGLAMITTLARAISKGDKPAALEALPAVRNVNTPLVSQNNNKSYCLLLACEKLDVEVVKALVAKGAKLDVVDKNGKNALFYAQNADNLEIAMYLIGLCPELITQADIKKMTPLHAAAEGNKIDFMRAYFNHETFLPLVDIRGENDQTPLHLAVRKGHIEATLLLLENGADADARENTNTSPYHTAFILSAVDEKYVDLCNILGPMTVPSLVTLVAVQVKKLYPGVEGDKELQKHVPEELFDKIKKVVPLYEKHQEEIKTKKENIAQIRKAYFDEYHAPTVTGTGGIEEGMEKMQIH